MKTSFSRGDAIEARFKGGSRYFPGKIACVNRNGTFDINYDDGDFEQEVREELIKRVEEEKKVDERSQLKKGDRIEARYKGGSKYYSGKIERVHSDGTFDIIYDDGDVEKHVKGEFVKKEKEAVKITSPSRSLSSSLSSEKLKEQTKSKSRRKSARSSNSSSSSSSFEIGDKVEARFQGKAKFFPGRISRKNPDHTFAVEYDDGDYEREVKKSLIKKLPKADQKLLEKQKSKSRSEVRSVSRSPRRKASDEVSRDVPQELDVLGKVRELGGDVKTRLRKEFERADVSGADHDEVSSFGFSKALKAIGIISTYTQTKDIQRLYPGKINNAKIDFNAFLEALRLESPRKSSRNEVVQEWEKLLKKYGLEGFSEEVLKKMKVEFKEESEKEPDLISLRHFLVVISRFDKIKWTKSEAREVAECFIQPNTNLVNFKAFLKAIKSTFGSTFKEEVEEQFKVGDVIEAKFGGGSKFFKGRISRYDKDNGRYDIEYDGDRERGVKAELIRLVTTVLTKFNLNDVIEARYKGDSKYFKGKITKVYEDGFYDILYDDGDVEKRVQERFIKKVVFGSEATPRSEKKIKTDLDVGKDFKVGDKILSPQSKDKKEKSVGEIRKIDLEKGTVNVLFADGEKKKHVDIGLIEKVKESTSVSSKFSQSSSDFSGKEKETEKVDVEKGEKKEAKTEKKIKSARPESEKEETKILSFGFKIGDKLKDSASGKEGIVLTIHSRRKTVDLEVEFEVGKKKKLKEIPVDQLEPLKMPKFKENDQVEAKLKRAKELVKGKVVKVNKFQGLYDVLFENGRKEANLPEQVLRLVKVKTPKKQENVVEKALVKERDLFSEFSSSTELTKQDTLKDLKIVLKDPNSSNSDSTESSVEEGDELLDFEMIEGSDSLSRKEENDVAKVFQRDKNLLRKCKVLLKSHDFKKTGKLKRKRFEKILKSLNVTIDSRTKLEEDSEGAIDYKSFLSQFKNLPSSEMEKSVDQDESFFIKSEDKSEKAHEKFMKVLRKSADLSAFRTQVKSVITELKKKQTSPNEIFKKLDYEGSKALGLSAFPLALKKIGFKLNKAEVYDLWKSLPSFFKDKKLLDYRKFTKELILLYSEDELELVESVKQDESLPQSKKVEEVKIVKKEAVFEDEKICEGYNKLKSVLTDALKNGLARDASEIFYMFDLSHTGFINLVDFREGCDKLGIVLSMENVRKFIQLMNLKNSALIISDWTHPNMLQISLPTFEAFLKGNDLVVGDKCTQSDAEAVESSVENFERLLRRQIRTLCLDNNLDEKEFTERFRRHDPNGLGFITFHSLKKIFYDLRIRVSLEQLETIFERFSVANREKFNFSLFANFVFCEETSLKASKAKLKNFISSLQKRGSTIDQVFSFFDKNSDEKVSLKELGKTLKGGGIVVSDRDLREVFRQLDIDKDGFIGKTEFKYIFNETNRSESTFFKEQQNTQLNYFHQQDETLPSEKAETAKPGKERNKIGEWLENEASEKEKTNFAAFMKLVNSFEKTHKPAGVKKCVENGEVVLPLGDKLKVAMRFLSS